MKTTLFLFLFTAMSCSAFAAENTKIICTHGNQQRTIEIIYSGEGAVPCAVQYTKDTSTQTLWRAEIEEGYCEDKVADLVSKHIGWGWECATVTKQ
jgi:hypothetical protein